MREALVSARATAQSLDRSKIDAIVRVARATSVTVTPSNERQTVAGFNMLLPAGFALVLFIGVMTGGQALLTSMVEEKSSRVIEVLLAAVSPTELLAGKLLAQLGVSFLALAFYVGTGMVMLVSFAMIGLLNPWLLVYLVIFFVISYLVTGAMLVTVGAAVNDMREAQSMMMPIMLMIMIPWIFWLPIRASRTPRSASRSASFHRSTRSRCCCGCRRTRRRPTGRCGRRSGSASRRCSSPSGSRAKSSGSGC